ncbi:TPA: hypothetical protein RQN23_003774 [Aeromonas veronii]|nr:hypothetical protein [Aeromonas veronii]
MLDNNASIGFDFDELKESAEYQTRGGTPSRNIALQVERYFEHAGRYCVQGMDMETEKTVICSLVEDRDAESRKYQRTSLETRAGDSARGVQPGGVIIMERSYKDEDLSNDKVEFYNSFWTHRAFTNEASGFYVPDTYISLQLYESSARRDRASAKLSVIDSAATFSVKTMQELKDGLTDMLIPSKLTSIPPSIAIRFINTETNDSFVFSGEITRQRLKSTVKNEYQHETVDQFKSRVFGQKGDQLNDQTLKYLQDRVFSQMPNGVLDPKYVIEMIRIHNLFLTRNAVEHLFSSTGKLPAIDASGKKPRGRAYHELFTLDAQVKDKNSKEGYKTIQVPGFCLGHLAFMHSKNNDSSFVSYFNPLTSSPEVMELKYMPTQFYSPDPQHAHVREFETPDAVEADDLNASAEEISEIAQAMREQQSQVSAQPQGDAAGASAQATETSVEQPRSGRGGRKTL